MRNFILAIAIFSCCSLAAQAPVNDNCSSPTTLGTLGAPGACGNGIKKGATSTMAGTNVNATSGTPYLSACYTANTPVNDVWYSFVAPLNGFGVTISITGGTIANPTIALYQYTGSCDSLQEYGCDEGSLDTASITLGSGIVPGQTYYIQVSGSDTTQNGTFNLSVYAFQNCADCLNSASLTVTPPPVNGAYQPGQVVSFCFHIDQWTQTENNWLHGVQMAFGPGWNLASLTTTPPPTYMSTAANEGGGTPATCGYWAYYPGGTTSSATGVTWPAGFYFNGTYEFNIITGLPQGCGSNTDADPGNNYGDGISNPGLVITPPANEWDFCWTIAVETGCNPGVSLSVQVTTSGDGESGAWTSAGCANDPVTNFTALISCCPPDIASTPTCTGTSNGTVTATPIGNSGPYTYTWSAGGQPDSIETGLAAGNYIVSVVDKNSCTATATVSVATDAPPVSTAGAAVSFCSGGTGTIGAAGIAGNTYLWSPTTGLSSSTAANPTVTLTNVTNNPVTTAYTVTTTTTATGCTSTASVNVTVNPMPSPTATNTGPYCLSSTIQLAATGGITYAWSGPNTFTSASQTPSITNATNAMAGVYTITATDANGCSATASTTVVINGSLTPIVSNTGPYCAGATIQLGIAGGTTYSWSGPNAFTSTSQTPSITGATAAMAGSYDVTATDASGCTGTGTTTVVVDPLPTPVASNTGPYCITSTIQLNVTTETSYSWSGPNAYTSITQNPSITNATVAMAGTYTVTVTDANGCTATASTPVVVTSTLTPIVSNTGPYCVGATVQLNVQGGTVFSWSGPNAFTSTGQNPTIPGATVAAAGGYDVTATDASGCSGTGTTNVVINQPPTPSADNTGPYCAGATIQLGALGGVSYAWSGPDAYINGMQTPAIANSTTAMGGVYNVTVTDVNGCTATTSTSVVVNAPPVANAGTGVVITCAAPQPTLNAAAIPAGDTYTWGGPGIVSGGNTDTPTVNAAGTYTLTVTDANNCTASDNVVVTSDVIPPNLNPGPGGTLTCTVTSVTLMASSTTTGATFAWSNAVNTASNPVNTPNTYTVTDTDPATGCTASASAIVTIDTTSPNANAGPNEIIGCVTGINLAGSSTTANATYSWSGTGIANDANTTSPLVDMSGTYTLVVTDPANGCTASASTNVTPSSQPVIEGNVTENPCPNVSLGQITLQVTSGTPPYNYLWSNSAITQDITNLAGGTYNVTVTDALSCTDSATYQVTTGSFVVQAEQNATINLGESVQLTGLVSGGSGQQTYMWTPFYNLSCVDCQSPVATPYVTMVYILQATDTNGCTGYDTITIKVNPLHTLYVPNAFSPNGDGNNDFFSVYGDLSLISFIEVKIFDRWGELVFESNKTNFAWDGTYRGILETPQVFVYVIKATFIDGYSPDPYKGSVTLIR